MKVLASAKAHERCSARARKEKTHLLEEGAHHGIRISDTLNETVFPRLVDTLLQRSIHFDGDSIESFGQSLQTLRKAQIIELIGPFEHFSIDDGDGLSRGHETIVQSLIEVFTGRHTGQVRQDDFDLRSDVYLKLLERAL